MTYCEKINEMRETVNFNLETAHDEYIEAESKLISLLFGEIDRAEVHSNDHGTGIVTGYCGNTVESLIVEIDFANCRNRFVLGKIVNNRFIKFENADEINEIWDKAFTLHNDFTTKMLELKHEARKLKLEAEKKAESDKKAEEKYQKQKEKAIRDFEELTNKGKNSLSEVDEFYYALGWLTKHVGNVYAALPDYLESAFTAYFGADTPCRVIDSRKKGPAGCQSQWSWSFAATLKKHDSVPSVLVEYLNPTGNSITNTSFILDLIDNYGFQFGKKQDTDQIKQTIPSQFITSFDEGFAA